MRSATSAEGAQQRDFGPFIFDRLDGTSTPATSRSVGSASRVGAVGRSRARGAAGSPTPSASTCRSPIPPTVGRRRRARASSAPSIDRAGGRGRHPIVSSTRPPGNRRCSPRAYGKAGVRRGRPAATHLDGAHTSLDAMPSDLAAPTGADMTELTPREIVSELDRFIIGQADAKRAVAVALRNRWRRKQLPDDIREEVYPKNILMIGPTGVGKTEISPPAGEARPGAVPQGRGDQVHRGRLRRPRRRADRPRSRRRRHRHGPRGDARAGQGPRPRGRREPRDRRARRRGRARPDPRDVPPQAARRASSTTRRSSSRSPTPRAPSR